MQFSPRLHDFAINLRLQLGLLLPALLNSMSSASSGTASTPTSEIVPPTSVIILHGLGRSALSMKRLEWTLQKEGYRVINLSYPSYRQSVQELADGFLAQILQEHCIEPTAQIHFVTHSLGGIILRQYLTNHETQNLGRVVMLAPPNRGSEVAEKMRNWFLYKFFSGPCGQQLGTGPFSLPRKLGPATFDVGVIAGDRSLTPFFSYWLPRPNDGTVSVQSTRLEGMKDFLVVHSGHTWIAWRKQVVASTLRFLKHGRFT